MEIKDLVRLLKRWYWLLILGLGVGIVSGVVISRVQKPVYEATTKVLIMRASQQNTSTFAYLTDDQLNQTFGSLVTLQPVLDAVSSQMGYEVFATQIQVQTIQGTQIVKVIVDDQTAKRSAEIANALVSETIQRYENLQLSQGTTTEAEITSQLKDVEAQMASLQSEINQTSDAIIQEQTDQIQTQMVPLQDEVAGLQKDIAALTPAKTPDENSTIAEKQARLNQIQPLLSAYQLAYSDLVVLKKPMDLGSANENKLALLQKTLVVYQQNYVDLTSQLQSLRQTQGQNVSNVIQIESAALPAAPIRPRVMVNTLLAGAVGLGLAIIVIFCMENLIEMISAGQKPARTSADSQQPGVETPLVPQPVSGDAIADKSAILRQADLAQKKTGP
jgi:capsular polysaccharide biosynthesis protein